MPRRRRPYWGNAAVLRIKDPALAQRLLTLERCDRIRIETRGSDLDVVYWEAGVGYSLSGGVGAASPDQRHIASLRQKLEAGSDLLIFLGFPNHRLLIDAWEAIRKQNRGLLIVEPDLDLLAAQLECGDLRGPLRSGKVLLAAGETWREMVHRIVEEAFLGGARTPAFQAGYLTLVPALQAAVTEMVKELTPCAQQAGRAFRELLERFGEWTISVDYRPGKRLWVHMDLRGKASFTLVQYHLVRHLLDGLRRCGWETRLYLMRDDRFYPHYVRLADLARFRPDAVLFLNDGAAFETALGNDLAQRLRIPKFTWWTDDPMFCRHLFLRHGFSTFERQFAADHAWVSFLRETGDRNAGFLPGASTYKHRGRKSNQLKCQINFVGQVRDQRSFFAQLPKEWRDYAERVVALKLQDRFRPGLEVMAAAQPPRELAEDFWDELRMKVLWEANTRYRVALVQSLIDLDLRLYGNPDWLSLLDDPRLHQRFYGTIPYSALPHLYRNSLVTLNVHSLQATTCLNVRDFDVPMAGGFLVTDALPGAEELFETGGVEELANGKAVELVIYHNLSEVRQIIEIVSRNEALRQACITRAQSRIQAEHTYQHRAKVLSQALEEMQRQIVP